MSSKQVRLIFGGVFFALLSVYSAASFYIWLYPPGSDGGWHGSGAYGRFHITYIDPQSPAKDLRPGDKIIAINGAKVADRLDALNDEYRLPPGSRYSMTVERDGRELTFTWQTTPRRRGPFPWNKLIPLLFALSGLLVLSLKAEDRQAWLLALMLCSFSTLLSDGFETQISANWLALPVALARIGGLFSAPLLFHLFLYFPHHSTWLRRWPKLTMWLYAPLCLFVLPTFGVSRLPLEWSTPIFSWPPMRWLGEHGLPVAGYLSLLGYLLAALFSLWLNYRAADTAGRRRLRVVMWGSLIGFGSLVLVLVMEVTNTREKWRSVWDWLLFSMLFTLPLVPLSFAYAIIRHRVIPISLILRRGVRYLLVSRGSILLVLLFTGLIVTALLSLLFQYLRPSALTVGLVSAAEGIAAWQAARWLHRRYLAPVIDRKFFRQSYDSQQIVAELAASLRTTTEIPSLLESVANKLQSALQTESVVEIEAENQQRAKEMEEARQLQLSMLPKSAPYLPHIEIAASMKPATEVGGDYYDWRLGADGALTIAIGDATGHGLKAGTMVTVTKGLFNHLAEQADLVATLSQTSRALKRMNLRSLFMAMTLVRLIGNRLQCSVAGMPPILIYRAATRAIEEIPLRGAPLGGLTDYAYRQAETLLSTGDVVLLLSDGLPERFNAAGEMFGYDRSKESLLANAHAAPQAIIERLLQTGEDWAAGKAADDDMTFVVLKMRPDEFSRLTS